MDTRKKIAQLIIARLDGNAINRKFRYYESLVKKGIGGFIVFGGSAAEIKKGIKNLQDAAEFPLFIASDLEQGLGQQVAGGTLFPPAMALAQAIKRKKRDDMKLLRRSLAIIAQEARAAGINVIFSPVLDVNTNPRNPIICTRAFSDRHRTVAWFGNEFIKGFQKHGIIACAKHFPGHGDTSKDSHRELPVIGADIRRLQKIELHPFRQAIKTGVKMMMVGHLKVPALDPRSAASISHKIISGVLKKGMKFQGIVTTDAMNMHALINRDVKTEQQACFLALAAGADILLHPGNPETVIEYLSSKWDEIMPRVDQSLEKILKTKESLSKAVLPPLPGKRIGVKSHWKTAHALVQKSITVNKKLSPASIREMKDILSSVQKDLAVLILDDDNCKSGSFFAEAIRARYPGTKIRYIDNIFQGRMQKLLNLFSQRILIIAVFSKISAWKGRSGLSKKLHAVLDKAAHASRFTILAGFCCPYILRDIKADVLIDAYYGSKQPQEAVAQILCDP
jgi:beta-glucosidase-like glycosyl hydrolase